MPGNELNDLDNIKHLTPIGPGLRQNNKPNSLTVSRAGLLRHKPPNMYCVQAPHRRYILNKGDMVVENIVHYYIKTLEEKFLSEIAIGMNGRFGTIRRTRKTPSH
ncbi:hypothetical protein Trydic_g11099 [Trypoxylus dichotomus]